KISGTEATDGGSTAQVSLLTGLQSLNVGSSSTPEGQTLSRINKRPSSIGEEGYYLKQDLEALFTKWKTEYDRNKRVLIKKGQLLDVKRGRYRVSKNHLKRLHHHRAKGKRTTRDQEQGEVFSSGDEKSFSDEDVAGDSGSLTGDGEGDDDGELYDDVSDDERGRSRGRRLRRTRSNSGTRGGRQRSHDKSSMSSSKKQTERDGVAKQEGKRHQCKACGKRFSRPSQLHTHSLTHSGEKPHICSVCSKNFNVASNLKRHMKTHVAARTAGNSADAAFRGHLMSFSLNTVAGLELGIAPIASVSATSGSSSSVIPVPTLPDATPILDLDQANTQQELTLPIETHPVQEQLAILEQQHLLQLQQQQLQKGEEQSAQPSPQIELENQPQSAPEDFIPPIEPTLEAQIVEGFWTPPSQLTHTLWAPGTDTIASSEISTLSYVASVVPEDVSDPVQGAHTSTSSSS
ncbi:hypothetical protein BG003_006292, partial [Podila horticola]